MHIGFCFGGETQCKATTWKTYAKEVSIITLGLQEVRWGDMDCIAVAQDRKGWLDLANALMSFRLP